MTITYETCMDCGISFLEGQQHDCQNAYNFVIRCMHGSCVPLSEGCHICFGEELRTTLRELAYAYEASGWAGPPPFDKKLHKKALDMAGPDYRSGGL